MKKEILEILQEINPLDEVNEDMNLLEEFLDSMGLLLLINELEEKYEIKIPLSTLKLEDFQNVDSIIELVKAIKE